MSGNSSGAKLLSLTDTLKASLGNKLSEVKFLAIDKISMVSSNLWTNIDAMLSDIISPSTDLSFTGLSVMVVGDYLQLSPVKMRFIFSRFTSRNKVNQLLSLQLRHLLKYA